MQYLHSDWVLICDEDFTILDDCVVVFDTHIQDILSLDKFKIKYPEITPKYLGENSVLMPGLINTHIHLEFSANKTTLSYGNFVKWLFSVINFREQLIEKATKELIDDELKKMIQNGTTTIGAISSYGFDMPSCIQSPINVVYFTEVLGSKAEMIDTLFLDFKEKLNSAISNKSESFTPAIAIHSPYSTHPFLIREVLDIAKNKDMAVSAHFAESKAENDWLNYNKGEFTPFFKDMLGQNIALQKPDEFLNLFKGIKNLSFTHCVQANENELKQIENLNATITHCPNSNRLLTNSILDLDHLDNINLAMGTDGLSSNHTLNMFEELRNAFYMHSNIEPNQLSKKLLLASTLGGAKALGVHTGTIQKGFDADLISFNLPDKVENKENLATAIILHITKPKQTYIKGNNELF
jgi:cytosine/adenosine deaminase-related metal-dependent hydrolase